MKKSLLLVVLLVSMGVDAQVPNAPKNFQDSIQAIVKLGKAKPNDADLNYMIDEFNKKIEDYNKEQATMPMNIRKRRRLELVVFYEKIMQSYQDTYGEKKKAEPTDSKSYPIEDTPTYSKSYPIDEYLRFLQQKGELTYTFNGTGDKMKGKRTDEWQKFQVELGDVHYDCKLILKNSSHSRHTEYVQIFTNAWNEHNKVEGKWEMVDGEIHFMDRSRFHHDFIVESNDIIVWDFLEPCRLKLNR